MLSSLDRSGTFQPIGIFFFHLNMWEQRMRFYYIYIVLSYLEKYSHLIFSF